MSALARSVTRALPATATSPRADSAGDTVAQALGWDHARHGVALPVELLAPGSALEPGWTAALARRRIGVPQPAASASVRSWLSLRLQAWQAGDAVELMSVTPHLLGQIAASHCPVTRAALTDGATVPVIARLQPQRPYDAGHLVMLGSVASDALARTGWQAALVRAARLERSGTRHSAGLGADAWARLGILQSFVMPLPHAQAASLPLRVLPPNRLRLCNPIQSLQVLVTRMLARSGWSRRLQVLIDALPAKPVGDGAAAALQRCFLALLARVLAAGQPTEPLRRRWALEDAWRDAEVLRLWRHFALQISASQARQLVERAAERQLIDAHIVIHADDEPVETDTAPAPRHASMPALSKSAAPSATVHRLLRPAPLARSSPLHRDAEQLCLPWLGAA